MQAVETNKKTEQHCDPIVTLCIVDGVGGATFPIPLLVKGRVAAGGGDQHVSSPLLKKGKNSHGPSLGCIKLLRK